MTAGAWWRGAAVVLAFLALVLGALVLVPDWLHPPLDHEALKGVADAEKRIQLQQAQDQVRNTLRSTLLQAVAGLLVLAGAVATWRQVLLAREGQITERFTRAVDQIGSDNVDVRVGGVYALERIARNSPADRDTVQFVLGAFVRNHAPRETGAHETGAHEPGDGPGERQPWMQLRRPDVQAVMQVLSRRPESPTGTRRLVLSHVDLRSLLLDPGARLSDSVFRHTDLSRARLAGVDLRRTDLTGTDLRLAHLRDADLRDAVLRGTLLGRADLTGADLSGADLRGADLRDAVLEGTRLVGAVADGATRWPAGFDARRRLGADRS